MRANCLKTDKVIALGPTEETVEPDFDLDSAQSTPAALSGLPDTEGVEIFFIGRSCIQLCDEFTCTAATAAVHK